MFLRISKVNAGGRIYEYLRIVENTKNKGKSCQRVIANLGKAEDLEGKIDGIVEKLRNYCKEKYIKPGEIEAKEAPMWGAVLVARKLWDEIGIGEIISKRCGNDPRRKFDIEDTAFVLTASSLLNPSSEHGLSWWLDNTYVCGRDGKRFLPKWRDGVTKENRVRVEWGQLNMWYRTLDILIKAKENIELDIYNRLRDLFGLKVDVVFYDITSLYFEGDGPSGLAEYGKSKDGKRRNKQILLGVVMASGWPVAHHVFSGNIAEKKTICGVVDDLKKRFEIENLIFVGDAGMISDENIEHIQKSGYRHIIAIKRRRSKAAEDVVKNMTDKWEVGDKGIQAQDVNIDGARYIVAKSNDRKEYEESIRTNNMTSTKDKLEKLKNDVIAGKLKKPEKIGYRASAVLRKLKGHRYFSWEITKDGQFNYWEDVEKMAKEKLIEGLYILRTNDNDISPLKIIYSYKELSDVEGAFREFKDVLEGRPIYHQSEERVKAHVFIRALAYLLDVALKKSMAKTGLSITVEEAIQALNQVRIADLKLRGDNHRIIFGAKHYARKVLSAVGLSGYKSMLPECVSVD